MSQHESKIWFVPKATREQAERFVREQPHRGAFVVRRQSKGDQLVLTCAPADAAVHCILTCLPSGKWIVGTDHAKQYASVEDILASHNGVALGAVRAAAYVSFFGALANVQHDYDKSPAPLPSASEAADARYAPAPPAANVALSGGVVPSASAMLAQLHKAPASPLLDSTRRGSSARASAPWRIAPSELTLGRELGEGSFGAVRFATWFGLKVAVKQLKALDNSNAAHEFETEIQLMAALQPHQNVVVLYGLTTIDGSAAAVMEFCALGSLVDALYAKPERVREWTLAQLILVAHEVACGVAHLHRHKMIHRDIAARNVLLSGTENVIFCAKLSDLGMSRQLDDNQIEQRTKNAVGPIKWMAPEQLLHCAYSNASDVWALGVTLFEIFARTKPYPEIASNAAVGVAVMAGRTLTPPSEAPKSVRGVMRTCWKFDAADRPTAQQVQEVLFNLIG